MALLERVDELRARPRPPAAADPGSRGRPAPAHQASSARSGPEPRDERLDLAERDLPLTLALQLGPPSGRLRLVLAVENQRVRYVVSFGNVEETRPEVVVLALAERRVVAQPVPIEQAAVDDHRRVEERRREERSPADGARPDGHAVHRAQPPVGGEVDHPGSHDRRARPGADALQDPLEPCGQRDVVSVHAGDVRPRAASRPTFSAPARPSGSAFRTHAADARPRGRRALSPGAVGRAVVDDDELEVALALAEHASDRLLDRPLGVAGSEDDGHEGRGHGGAEGSLRRWRETSASTSSSRRSIAPTTSQRCSPRSRRRRTRLPARRRRSERRRPHRAAARGVSRARRAAPALAARALTRPQRRTAASHGGPCRLPGRRLPLSARPARAGRAALRGRPRSRRAERTTRRGRRDGRGALAGERSSHHAGHRLAPRQLPHDLPTARGRRASRRLRRGARARQWDALVVGRGDRLRRPRPPRRRPGRVRPGAGRDASGQGGQRGRARRARPSRRRQRRLRARTEPLPGPHRRADARAPGRRGAPLARSARHDPRAVPRRHALGSPRRVSRRSAALP